MEAAEVILFDGVCGLCNRLVNFVLGADKRARFRFAALQSSSGRRLLAEHGLSTTDFDSVILIVDGRVFQRSSAVLQILRRLGFPWSLLWPAVLIPAHVRDAMYDAVAKRRYRWFGRTASCRVPTAAERTRFLN